MSEKIRLKGQLKLPVVGRNPIFAQMKFVKVALSEPDILPDSGSIFTCDEQGNYDFEIYTGAHLLSYNVGNAWSKPIEIIAEPLAEGLENIEISDLIGFQEIPELDSTIAALNQQKQELLAIQQDVIAKQIAVATAAEDIDSTVADVAAGYPSMLAAQLSKSVTVNVATGDDATADGSSAKPYKTIKAAIESQVDSSYVSVFLQGGIDKATAHVIDSTINISRRYIAINMNNNHVTLGDSLSIVFSAISCTLTIGNGGFMHASTSKTILKTEQGSRLGIGGYYAFTLVVAASAAITLIFMSYLSRSGASEVNTYKLSIVDTDMTTPSSAQVRTAAFEASGTACFFCHSQGSLGNNYSDSLGVTANLAGSFKVCAS